MIIKMCPCCGSIPRAYKETGDGYARACVRCKECGLLMERVVFFEWGDDHVSEDELMDMAVNAWNARKE